MSPQLDRVVMLIYTPTSLEKFGVSRSFSPSSSNVAMRELYLKGLIPSYFLRFLLHVTEGLLLGMLKKCKSETLKAKWKAQNTTWIIQMAILPPSKWTFRETIYAFLIGLENPPNAQSSLNVNAAHLILDIVLFPAVMDSECNIFEEAYVNKILNALVTCIKSTNDNDFIVHLSHCCCPCSVC